MPRAKKPVPPLTVHQLVRRAYRRRSIEANLFPGALAGIDDWDAFRWHRGSESGDTLKLHSSQALAIDVFGTLRAQPSRDAVLDALAQRLGLPAGGPWQVELEWTDPDNLLREKQPTRVDAVARGARCLIFFECKFTEPDGGACGQVQPISSGKHKGLRQCSGLYWPQVNPATGAEARCALAAKGIRYWDQIPAVFGIDPGTNYLPCPFAGAWFQWMRNLTVCRAVAQAARLAPAFVVVYADGPGLPMAERIRHADWERFTTHLNPAAITFSTLPFQGLLRLAQAACPADPTWPALAGWVQGKIDAVCPPPTPRD